MAQSKALGNVFKLNDVINVKSPQFGAKGDGVADDTAALNSAFAQTGRTVWIPKGNYKVTANLAEPVVSQILGDGSNDAIITAAAGVTKVFSLAAVSGARLVKMAGFSITGNATASARGMVIGDGAVQGGVFEDVWVHGFSGAGAIACYVRNIVAGQFSKCVFSDSTECVKIEGTTHAWPTQSIFLTCFFGGSSGAGVNLATGRNIIFKNCDFEDNTQEGFYSRPANAAVLRDIVLEDCWFEGNYPADITQHQVLVDGTLIPAEYSFRMVRGQYVSGVGTAKSIKINGNVIFDLEDITLANANNPQLTIAGAALGYIRLGTLNAGQYNAVVSDAGNVAFNRTTRSGTVTLTANAATTTVLLGALGVNEVTNNSRVILTPTSANAAADQGSATGVYVSAKTPGTSFVITHPNNANADKTFDFEIVG